MDTHTGEYMGPHSTILNQNSKNIPRPEDNDALEEATQALAGFQRKLTRQTHSGCIITPSKLARRCVKEKPLRRPDYATLAQVRAAQLYLGAAVVGPRDRNAGTSFIV